VASAAVKLGVKQLLPRARPDRAGVPAQRGGRVRMPGSRSFPSGHAASAFAFATAAGRVLPAASTPLHLLAVAGAYSRVHTGAHYPVDVIAGAAAGVAAAAAVSGHGPTGVAQSHRHVFARRAHTPRGAGAEL